jgi:hypothetical protein
MCLYSQGTIDAALRLMVDICYETETAEQSNCTT